MTPNNKSAPNANHSSCRGEARSEEGRSGSRRGEEGATAQYLATPLGPPPRGGRRAPSGSAWRPQTWKPVRGPCALREK